MQTHLLQKNIRLVKGIQYQSQQPVMRFEEPQDLQNTLQNVIAGLSIFREELLNGRNAREVLQTLSQLKLWLRDKPLISGMVLGKIETLENMIDTTYSHPVINQDSIILSSRCPQAEIVESLEMCQHIFFMEMAINNTLLI